MIFNKDDYFKNNGFKGDPFASTNAVHEDQLEKYFVTPPYFLSLIGSIEKPKSSIVIAPRGSGKTAQRKMIESMSEQQEGVISIVYTQFPIEGIQSVSKLTYEMHLRRVIKYLLLALLSQLKAEESFYLLDSNDKRIINNLNREFLNNLNETDIHSAINTIKGIKGKLQDLWLSTGESINSVINLFLKKNKLSEVDLTYKPKSKEKIADSELLDSIKLIEKIFNKIGINSVFILIDSVDETILTGNDSNKAYQLIKPLIKNLGILEMETIVFKFFLWDKIKEHWSDDIRLDRIEIFEMKWTKEQIRQLINKRIAVFSSQKYANISSLINYTSARYIDMIYDFAYFSPRDAINIMKSIFDDHLLQTDLMNTYPNENNVISGIDRFCENKFSELITNQSQQKDLRRIKKATFTIPYLYTYVYKCEASTARNKLMPWTRAGIVIASNSKLKLAGGKMPINVYTFTDIRIARAVCSNQKLDDFYEKNIFYCNECEMINVFDKINEYGLKEWQCINCQSEYIVEDIS